MLLHGKSCCFYDAHTKPLPLSGAQTAPDKPLVSLPSSPGKRRRESSKSTEEWQTTHCSREATNCLGASPHLMLSVWPRSLKDLDAARASEILMMPSGDPTATMLPSALMSSAYTLPKGLLWSMLLNCWPCKQPP